MKRKRLNVMRRQGSIWFKRETAHYSDGTPRGEVLWVFSARTKPRKAVPVEVFEWVTTGKREVSALLGTYRIASPVAMAKLIREHLKADRS